MMHCALCVLCRWFLLPALPPWTRIAHWSCRIWFQRNRRLSECTFATNIQIYIAFPSVKQICVSLFPCTFAHWLCFGFQVLLLPQPRPWPRSCAYCTYLTSPAPCCRTLPLRSVVHRHAFRTVLTSLEPCCRTLPIRSVVHRHAFRTVLTSLAPFRRSLQLRNVVHRRVLRIFLTLPSTFFDSPPRHTFVLLF